MLIVAALATVLMAGPVAAGQQTRIDVDVSEWNVGSGQSNGEFVTGERYGVQIGIRAQARFVGPLDVTRDKKVGVYQAETGVSDGLGRATWNYDLHVDLRGAQGVAAGRKLGDYSLVLTSDIGICGAPAGCELLGIPPFTAIADLSQESWNPKFFNPGFDATAEDTYHFTLTLTPQAFNGPPIEVKMRVEVTDP
jgi:hypothetical protein